MTDKSSLLVEDNPDDEALTLRGLKRNDIRNEVVVTMDAVEALDYVHTTRVHKGRNPDGTPAVVLLDLKLPKVEGLEVLRQIRADRRTRLLPVLVPTSSKEESDLINGYKLGDNAYARKPVDFSKFVGAIRELGMVWPVRNGAPPRRRPR